ncbi:MAG: metallophosphoesterase [Candidatus Ozemobacteraceae bacterium]
MTDMKTRILHFSDVHFLPTMEILTLRDFLALRRIAGWLNYALFRRSRFAASDTIVDALAAWSGREAFDANLFTGDATSLGAPGEIEQARKKLEPFTHLPGGLLLIPGNHDRYVIDGACGNRFDAAFSNFYRSDLPETTTDGHWPQVRLIGNHSAIILLHGASPHRYIWFSCGAVPDIQIEGLKKALAHPHLQHRTVFVATHHGPYRPEGHADTAFHGLGNTTALFSVLREHPRTILVHGHIHHRFHHPATADHPAIFCAGSVTFSGRETAWVYEIDESACVRGVPADFLEGRWVLRPEQAINL